VFNKNRTLSALLMLSLLLTFSPTTRPQSNSGAGAGVNNAMAADASSLASQAKSLTTSEQAQLEKALAGKDGAEAAKKLDVLDKKNTADKDKELDKAKDNEYKSQLLNDVNKYFSQYGLRPFGYELFRGTTTALVPGTDLPTPDNYKLEPGDSLTVETYGQVNRTFQLPIEKDGIANVPEIGPLALGGMELGSARSMLEAKVKNSLIATNARISVSQLRSSRVIVVGDAEKPGSYVLSGIPTVTAALFASGGVKEIGSLRKVELRRDGKLVRTLDIYAELLSGDTSKDVQVFPGDAIFIPVVGDTIGVRGEVFRPAVYELLNERSVGEAIKLAGGFTPNADISRATIDRIKVGKDRVIESIDLTQPDSLQVILHAGDLITIPSIIPILENKVEVSGAILRPVSRGYTPGMRVLDVISSPSELPVNADLNYVLIARIDPTSRKLVTLSLDLDEAFHNPQGSSNIRLQGGDKIYVFDKFENRDKYISGIIRDIQRQAMPTERARVVNISGQINSPGTYPLDEGMTIRDLLRAGGGLKDSAFTESAELTRFKIVDGQRRIASVTSVNLKAVSEGSGSLNMLLQPYDQLLIQTVPDWSKNESVELIGEFKFPGTYTLRNGETLAQLIQRAGGFSDRAFLPGAIFTREDLRQREIEQKNKMIRELKSSIAIEKVDPTGKKLDTAADAQLALDQLNAITPIGRMVIDLPSLSRLGRLSDSDITLRDHDKLIVPRKTEEISVIGEVHNQTSFLYKPGMTKQAVIDKAGGFTRHADKKAAYIIKANGDVIAGHGFFRGANQQLEAGDTVIVPTDIDRVNPLIEWSTISQMVYQFAVTASSLKVIGVL
jgi:polysaccharide biosynthesis/export protein